MVAGSFVVCFDRSLSRIIILPDRNLSRIVIRFDPCLRSAQLVRHVLDLLGIEAVEHPVICIRDRRTGRNSPPADIAVPAVFLQHNRQHFVSLCLIPSSAVNRNDPFPDILCHNEKSPSVVLISVACTSISPTEENLHNALFYKGGVPPPALVH